MLKDEVYGNNPRTDNDLKKNIQNAVPLISPTELQHVS
jgi:hypothetical protein